MTRFSIRASLATLTLVSSSLVAGCSFSSTVAGPNASTAYDVTCTGGRWACAREASELCHGRPYVVLDEDTGVGMLSKSSMGSLRIQCADVNAAAMAAIKAEAPSESQIRATACARAHGDIDAIAARWRAFRQRPDLTSLPTEARFVSACVALPDAARVCLNPRYAASHEKPCDAAYAQVPEDVGATFDALFSPPKAPPLASEGAIVHATP